MPDIDYGGFFTDEEDKPKKKRPRTAARDVEQPAAEAVVEDAETPDYGGFFAEDDEAPATAQTADLKRGAPPGPAGEPRRIGQAPRAWYEDLLDSTQSALQGAAVNLGDEAAGAARWGLGKLGLMHDVGSLEENMGVMKTDADRVTRAYPYAHGAGQAAIGMTTAPISSVGGQAAVQGALGAASEYADTRDPWRTLGAGALSVAAGAGGAWVGNKVARLLASSPSKALERLGGVHEPPGPRALPAPDAAPPPIPESGPPRPMSGPPGAPYDPLAAQTNAVVPDVPQSLGPPRPLPVESYPGGYDPLAAQQMATPVGVPRPLPVPEGGGGVPPDAVAKLLRGSNGKFQKVLPMELDMSPAPRLAPGPEDAVPYGSRWDLDLPPDAPLDFAPRPRIGGVSPEHGPAKPSAAEYLLGGVDAPTDALPRPRLAGPAVAPDAPAPYSLGGLDTTPPAPLSGAPAASERELQAIALNRAQNEMQPTKMGAALRGGSTLVALGGHPALAAGMRAGSALLRPGAREAAIRSGYLVPNQDAGMAARMFSEAAWELGAPAVHGGPVNAQDGEQVAYASSPTLNYALSATLHGGRTGLSPQDEEALTSAVVRGDDKAIAATDFRLRQKYPAYARQVERALRDLNEEER